MSTTNRKPRATRQEMIARKQAELAALLAKENGTFQESEDNLVMKQMRGSLRKRRTLLHRAGVILNGHPGTEKSPSKNSIDQMIANAEKRIADLRETKRRAEEQVARLPFDIKALEDALEAAEKQTKAGETVTVEFPADLLPIAADTEAETEENARAEQAAS